jgi:hypothetical protein
MIFVSQIWPASLCVCVWGGGEDVVTTFLNIIQTNLTALSLSAPVVFQEPYVTMYLICNAYISLFEKY